MKKVISVMVMLVLVLSSFGLGYSETLNIDTDVTNGVVKVQVGDLSSKIMLLVEKDGVKYTYPIVDSDVNVFPLQMGNGVYNIRVMQNIEGTKYKEISKVTSNLDLEDKNNVYLNSIQDIEWKDNQQAIIKATALTKGLKTDADKVKAIYTYITKNYKYDYDKAKTVTSGYFPKIDDVYSAKKGICYDYSALFAAMLRSQGIPTKLVKGYATPTGDVYHAWNEVYVNGTWKVVDTTTDAPSVQAGKTVSMYKSTAAYSAQKTY